MIKINDRIFAETKITGCNIGWINTAWGVILIDTPALPLDIAELKRALAGKTIAHTIYTHEHFDHVLGSEHFNHHIIAHANVVPEIEHLKTHIAAEVKSFFPLLYEQHKAYIDNVKVVSPQITFKDELTLFMGDVTLELFYVGGHSPASIFVYLPQDKLLFCGDTVNFGMPYVPPKADLLEWIELLKRVGEMDIEKIVPGHGEICGKNEAKKFLVYFEAMRKQVAKLIRQGANKLDVIQQVNLHDYLPVPMDDTLKMQIAYHTGMMYDRLCAGK